MFLGHQVDMICLTFALWLFLGQPHLLLRICLAWELCLVEFHMVVYCGIVSWCWYFCWGRILQIALLVWCHHLLLVVDFPPFHLLVDLLICIAFWHPLNFLQSVWTVSASFNLSTVFFLFLSLFMWLRGPVFYIWAIFFLYFWVFPLVIELLSYHGFFLSFDFFFVISGATPSR